MNQDIIDKINSLIQEYKELYYKYNIASDEIVSIKDRLSAIELERTELKIKLHDIRDRELELVNYLKENDVKSYLDLQNRVNSMISNKNINPNE
jgi:predicted nuclease with TOPRIM domain